MSNRLATLVLLATLASICLGVSFTTSFAAEAVKLPRVSEPDMDGDGLSDFAEIHKYLTDPQKHDTDGDGSTDGDWRQRREFSYSVRAVIRVMPPYNLDEVNDDYQDARVLKETDDYVELEVIAYPLNTIAESVEGNPSWRQDYAQMKEYLAPGPTTNWDETMRRELFLSLREDGIDANTLTDKEVVEQVSRWLFRRSQHRSMFCTFYVGFRDGQPHLLPGTERAFERDKGNPAWTTSEQFAHELYGREMFARKCYGTCTSTGIYQTTVLRALGIPTRMILCIPPADASDAEQVEMADRGIENHEVRWTVSQAALAAGNSFSSHTFCEVFVGGRWRRLNYTNLAQNILDPNYLGLMIKVHTFSDLSEARLGETWGVRYARGDRGGVFKYSNPYRLMELSDHYGKHASIPNPKVAKELNRVTITRAYWPDQNAPDAIQQVNQRRGQRGARQDGRGLQMHDRSFYVHCKDWIDDAGGYLQYKRFLKQADPNFALRAKDLPDVLCRLSMGYYTHRSSNLCELEVVIPKSEYTKMSRGVGYTLHPLGRHADHEWVVDGGVTLTRSD